MAEARPEVPRELSRIVQRCLAKEPTRRLQNVLDVRNELEELKADWSSGELQEAAPALRPSVNTWLAAFAVVLLVTLAGVLVYFMRSPDETIPRLVNPVQMTSAVGVEDYPTWSLDGGRVAYESDQSGNWDIWVAQVGGGDPVNLTRDNEGNDRYPSWSTDEQQIAFVREEQAGSLFSMSAVGGRPREIRLPSDSLIERHSIPQWSADDSEIAVAVQRPTGKAIAIVSLESLEARLVSIPPHEGSFSADLSWSPDSRTFAYVDSVGNADLTQLWLIPSAGGEPTPVTDGRTRVFSPRWSSDGRRLYFVSNRGGAMDLWQRRVGEGQPVGELEALTTGMGIRRAAFSPDGSKLAYSKGDRVSNVFRVPILHDRVATWADARQITFDTAWLEVVDVSPDGSRLAVSSDRNGNQDLWILPAEGGEMTQLTTDPTPDWAPSWSPDGTEIAFHAFRSGNREVWVMPSNGGPARRLTNHPSGDQVPNWSIDGNEIAFSSGRGGTRELWIVDAEGGEPRPLTTGGNFADWSPDGSSIVFVRGGEIWRMPADGSEEERIGGGPASHALWSPEGKLLYYTGSREHSKRLWALSPSDGREYVVADLRGRPGMMGWCLSTDGVYLYFTWREDLGDIWVMDVVK